MIGRDAGKTPLFNATDTSLEYSKDGAGGELSKFTMDRVFGMGCKQEEVFEEIGETAVQTLRQGFNSTILAYGQTGSGKTFSMEGLKDDSGAYTSRGLIPRLFDRIFDLFGSDESIREFTVSLQFIELYKEALQDLFGKRKVLDVKMDEKGGYKCPAAVTIVVKDGTHALQIYNEGCKQRATASTDMNSASSRSHALLIVNIEWKKEKEKSYGQLNLVDLAGSEGMKKTGATGEKLKEGIKINLSLTKLALVVKCLSEGASHIPFRESKLTMMLQKGLGGNNMLHIILALSNDANQVAEGTACLRFGQSCLSMTINPNANEVEKEAAEMKAVIKEQLNEISDLQSENAALKQELETRRSMVGEAVPDFLVAKHIALNKDALADDLRETNEQIEELKRELEAKKAEAETLRNVDDDSLSLDSKLESYFEGMDAQAKAEAIETRRRQAMIDRMKAAAGVEQERKAFENELEQMLEIQKKLQSKLASADEDRLKEEERIKHEAEAAVEAEKRLIEEKAQALEAQLAEREAAQQAMEEETRVREKQLQEQLAAREEMLKAEEAQRAALMETTQADNAKMQEELAKLAEARRVQEEEIEHTRKEKERLAQVEKEAAAEREKSKEAESKMAEELAKMKDEMKRMEAEAAAARAAGGPAGYSEDASQLEYFGQLYKTAPEMIRATARKLARTAKSKKMDPIAVGRVIQTLPVLVACNDLRALTELEPGNRTLFQDMGGVIKLVDYLFPHGAQAPYATHIARTLPCVMDPQGRRQFGEYAAQKDSDGTVRLTYLSALLLSNDPDDRENACLAIAAIAQDAPDNRKALFENGISTQVMEAFMETSAQKMPRQRLQRVAVMALSELAQDFEPFQAKLLEKGCIRLLLSQASPTNDPFVIKETLSCIGRVTQGNRNIQKELHSLTATNAYSQLLFAQMHDSAITELAGLALVNLVSQDPDAMATVTKSPRYSAIRFEMLAAMARALSSSMLRQRQTSAGVTGSDKFRFWGTSVMSHWEEGNAGGDRTHTSFADNPQFLLRAAPGTNLCLVLHDTLEDTRQRDRGKARPLFLRLCVTAATPEVLATRLKYLDINASGNRPATSDADTAVMLEPSVNGFIDVAKTREICMRATIKSAAPEDMWIVVPHVGCSHQHSKFTLSIFADAPVTIEGELHAWSKRTLCSAWTPLCSAPRAIVDARWRNCPQFQLMNNSEKAVTVRALLSYAERDEQLNTRHLQTVDAAGGRASTGEERPMLSAYVMKNNVPDKRYVGNLSPQADNYVGHSLVTNSWCVQTRLVLEPGNVYALLVVMGDETTTNVPLRLTFYSPPECDEGDVLVNPLSSASEWHVAVLQGVTDTNGMTVFDVRPGADVGSVQVTLVVESAEGSAFCSITTTQDGVPHKQTPTYAQKSAVLTVPLTGGHGYTVATRCITQRQEPIRSGGVKVFVYSTRPLDVTPSAPQLLCVDDGASSAMVAKTTAEQVVYGEEKVPEDTTKPKESESKEDEFKEDPAVLASVVDELEKQRDELFKFTCAAVKSDDGFKVLETLRREKEDLRAEVEEARQKLRQAEAKAAGGADLSDAQRKLQRDMHIASEFRNKKLKDEAKAAKKAEDEQRALVAKLQQQLAAAGSGGGGYGDGVSAQQLADAQSKVDAAKAEAAKQVSALESKLTVLQAQRDMEAAKAESASARYEAVAAKGSISGGGGGEALQSQVESLKKQLDEAKAAAADAPKSAACLVQ